MVDYKEDIDYTFIEVNNVSGIKILTGEFIGVIYTYSNVSISEDEKNLTKENLPPVLSFNFDVVDFASIIEEDIYTLEFKDKIGDILMSILTKSMENTVEPEPSYIEELTL